MKIAPLVTAFASFAAVASLAGAARAEVTLTAEPQAGIVVPNDAEGFLGGAARLGYAFDSLYPILVAPELSLEGHAITTDPVVGTFRAVGGVRVGILASVEPSVYVHAGYGGVGVSFAPALGANGLSSWASNFTLDAGAALDFRLERWITLGVAAGYVGFFGDSSLHGAVLGPHVTFWL